MNDNARELVVYSWTLKEFQEAVRWDMLYSSVADVMEDGKHGERQELVESKYSVVGGSCRYMFECSITVAIREYKVALEYIANYDDYLHIRFGDRSEPFLNRLCARYKVGNTEFWTPISKFVATELASKIGKSFVIKLMKAGFPDNPVLQGFVFEMLFFARISRGKRGVVVYNVGKKGSKKQAWGRYLVESFDPKDGYLIASQTKVCLKPPWNQGGYDAVLIDKGMHRVRFVQLTKNSRHDLKLEYMLKCLKALGINGGDGWGIEIVFVVDKDMLAKFRVGSVDQPGALSEYGWAKGNEKKQVDVVGMDARTVR
eukprot:765945-Hanusia_phi.AAC.1